jgi:hypothetical protein
MSGWGWKKRDEDKWGGWWGGWRDKKKDHWGWWGWWGK